MNAWSASARKCVCRGLLAFSLSAIAVSSHALVLAPEQSGAPVPRIDLDSFVILAQQRIPFGNLPTDTGVVTGEIIDRVLLLPDNRLAFETRVLVDRAPTEGVIKVTRTLFGAFPLVEVGYEDVDAGMIFTPSSASRPGSDGSQVDFLFSTPITARPGGTAAEEWTTNPLVIITGPTQIDLIGSFQAFGPTAVVGAFSLSQPVFSPVPEPRIGVFLVLGLTLIMLYRRPAV